ncbi:regulator of G-protein signaling 2 [Hemicordylus capensis]|uniref:regulator of G-protein signaling 2 n=1 Tax=Hemicordylus capensis TaxID=884348 RepID=UPI0023035412|nr:regulator of G-protein signaling 2 [Hemicordylus capensis]
MHSLGGEIKRRRSMQSAMFLALQHNCNQMERSASNCQSKEEKKGKMKKTILRDWKSRISCFLQNSSSSASRKANKNGKPKAFVRPTAEEAQLWSEAFDELLSNKYGIAAFRAFLKSEFCEENIDFWLACEDFKKTKSPQKLSSKAKKIYNDFIEREAPKEINIDFQTKNVIAQNLQEATHSCFSAAQKRVYSLMENNSYPRFLESEFYQELCKKSPISREPQGT